jgi:NADH-quinone oxidoreductase subunit H
VFFVYFTCAVASVNRAPFDLAEAESELVAGFHTEYSGLRWSFFFMAEYGSMFLVSGLAAILFFGGWNGPIPIFHMLGWAYPQGATEWTVGGYIAQVAGVLNFILKAVVGVTVMMWVRWTLPRLRIDQVMTTCLKYCVPLAAICFVGAMVWKLNGWISIHDFAPQTGGAMFADVRENWVLEKGSGTQGVPGVQSSGAGEGTGDRGRETGGRRPGTDAVASVGEPSALSQEAAQ